jgi:divalent metal cation (Fe/Co/Zn/Cd) transporter
VVFEGTRDLLTGETPDTSVVGIVLTGLSIVVMPALAWAKRRAGEEMGSRLGLAALATASGVVIAVRSIRRTAVPRGAGCRRAVG